MTTLLESQITLANEAADGRLFLTPETAPPEAAPPIVESLQMRRIMVEYQGDASAALQTLGRIEAARSVGTRTADTVTDTELEEARFTIADLGTVWRRQIDVIGRAIAEAFPDQEIATDGFKTDEMAHVSDGTTLYRIAPNDDGELTVWAYSSLLSQNQYNEGVGLATETMWRQLLTHVWAS